MGWTSAGTSIDDLDLRRLRQPERAGGDDDLPSLQAVGGDFDLAVLLKSGGDGLPSGLVSLDDGDDAVAVLVGHDGLPGDGKDVLVLLGDDPGAHGPPGAEARVARQRDDNHHGAGL